MKLKGMKPLALLLILSALLVPTAHAQPNPGPEQLHVTLGTRPGTLVIHWAVLAQPYSSIDAPVVTWQNGSAPAQLVGTIRMGGVSVRTTGYYETFVYGATIGPFDPNTEITYRVGSAQRGMSTPRSIQLPPSSEETLRFVAYGDIGIDATAADGSKNPTRPEHPAHTVRDLTIAQKPDLFLIPGDLSYNNARDGWDSFMRFSDPLQSTVPTMPVIGNHEWAPENNLGYHQFLNQYVLPGDEHNYVFRAGPVTFIGVNSDSICNKPSRGSGGTAPRPCDTNNGESINTELLNWVATALEEAAQDETPWTVAYHHHPAYSWGSHGNDWAVNTLLAPLYTQHGVDLVITAHDHMYARTHPVIDSRIQLNATEYPKGTAPIYVVAGGGGRSLYNLRTAEWPEWLAHAEKVHHLVRVDVNTTRLEMVALRADGSEMDRFAIQSATAQFDDGETVPTPLPFLALLAVLYALRKSRGK